MILYSVAGIFRSHEFSRNDIKEFIKSGENFEFLILGDAVGPDDAIAIFSGAIEHCEHLSELYFSGKIDCEDLCQCDEILMPKVYPYDRVGDTILDSEDLHPVNFERLRQYTEDD